MFEIYCEDIYGNIIDHLTQWDINQRLIIKDEALASLYKESTKFYCHFDNAKSICADVVKVPSPEKDTFKINIPNKLLQESYTIFAYLYIYSDEDTAKTLAQIEIPVRARVKPNTYDYVDNIEELKTYMQEKTEALKQELEAKADATIGEVVAKAESDFSAIKNQGTEIVANLTDDYNTLVSNLKNEYSKTIDTIISNVQDGSPKGYFSTVEDAGKELTDKESGIYVCSENGWIYYWNGECISDGICQYLSSAAASDYSQNDENKPDFIKNRPFYSDDDGNIKTLDNKFLSEEVYTYDDTVSGDSEKAVKSKAVAESLSNVVKKTNVNGVEITPIDNRILINTFNPVAVDFKFYENEATNSEVDS